MCKKFILFSAFAGMAIVTLSSYQNGPYQGGNLNRTGSAGSSANCSGGCHGSNTASTIVNITLSSNGQTVTSYTPGQTYTVTITGSNANNLPYFGFQASCVKNSSTSTQAGSFAASGTNPAVRNASGSLQLVEHNSPIAGTAAGSGYSYSTSFSWTAPAAGTGSVKFFVTLNAVNHDGTTNGDQPNANTALISEATTGVSEATKDVALNIFPNPAQNDINIHADNVTPGTYSLTVFDLTGKKLESKNVIANGSELETSVSVGGWAAGLYHIQLSKDGMKKVIPFVKN
ncbi:choice-of-anchor V domain-containing protein [Taibaiella soli]|uniref:Secretion system C-terminal sorting domain-containing protein n=1 Tax=Taibaiella soli TaxID=1649169 RepID=A0A2W2AIW1_9BACT|nr:choice-of-anchor V domain-containing protein [Taibaiella soli]PZF73512.1 hypothetical protein DN068_07240 [Taibaiella soli]